MTTNIIKPDCFKYNGHNELCRATTRKHCWDCPFYKTAAQVKKENEQIHKRWKRMGLDHLISHDK